MKTSRLWKLLRSFNKKEVKELKKFVASPFFNQREDVVKLYDELMDCIHLKKITPTKEDVFRYVYPKDAFDSAQIHLISSLLYKVIEQYMTYCELHENEINAKIQLAAAYRKRKLEDHFERTLEETQTLHQKTKFKNAEFYDLSYQIMFEEFHFQSDNQRMEAYKLQEISDNMDTAFIAKKLRQSCDLLSHQTIMKKQYDFGLQDKIMEYLEAQESIKIPAVSAYYYCYKMLKGQKEEDFIRFKAIIVENASIFPDSEIKDLYLAAINFCIKRMNDENLEYVKNAFSLYQQMLEKGVLIENNVISRFAYRNIVSTGVVLKEFDWVEKFIKNYTQNLEINYKETMYSLSLGRLNYERGNLKEAMSLLQKADYTDLLLNLSAKTILMKIYYELDEYDLLSSHLTAMKTFIKRHKNVLGYHSTNYSNIAHYTQKLNDVNKMDKNAVEKLVQDINAETVLTERKWILRMLGL